MKKLLALVLAALLAISLIACGKDDTNPDTKNDEGENEEVSLIIDHETYDLTFDINEDGNYEITGIVHNGITPLNVVIPDMYDNRPISGISDEAFKACKNLVSVTIPSSITYVGKAAFYDCDGLVNVTIHGSVKEIKSLAFAECNALAALILQDGVLTVGDYAFQNCTSLLGITFSNTLSTIGAAAFRNCDALASVAIPNTVTAVGDMAFSDCDKLAAVYAYGNPPAEGLGRYLFVNCAEGMILHAAPGTAFEAYATANGHVAAITNPGDPSIGDWQ
jgi:hypothetical protein